MTSGRPNHCSVRCVGRQEKLLGLLQLVRAVRRGVGRATTLIGAPRITTALTYCKVEASGEARVRVGLVPTLGGHGRGAYERPARLTYSGATGRRPWYRVGSFCPAVR